MTSDKVVARFPTRLFPNIKNGSWFGTGSHVLPGLGCRFPAFLQGVLFERCVGYVKSLVGNTDIYSFFQCTAGEVCWSPSRPLPGSCSGLTWHFQDTDPDFGQTQAKNLQLHFEQMLAVRACSMALDFLGYFASCASSGIVHSPRYVSVHLTSS